jgi:hypothetical protein
MRNVQDTGLQFFKSGILFKIQNRVQNYLLGLNAIHRNYICKVRTRNIRFQIETKNILWNEYLCST